MLCMSKRQCGVVEPLGGVLADRLEHPEPLARVANEAFVDKRLQRVELSISDLLVSFERAAAAEDGDPGKEPPLGLVEQLVAPFDRGAERLLSRVGVPPALEQIAARRAPFTALGGRE